VNQVACPAPRPAPRRLASFALASVPGSERAALTQVADSVADLNLPPRRLDKLKTAVAEATMNAIEYGNENRPDLAVNIEVFYSGTEIIVTITDHGGRGDSGWADEGGDTEIPDLARKLSGDQGPRGWGLFLIRHMVDDMEVTAARKRRTVRLTMRTPAPEDYDTSGDSQMDKSMTSTGVRMADGATSVIDIKGEVTAASEAVLMSAYEEAVRQGARRLVLNFTGLEYMNSGGIGMLVTLLVRANRQGQPLAAYGLSDHYREIFDLTRLDEAITIYDDERSALAG
jgi:anti-anti-sigma factor